MHFSRLKALTLLATVLLGLGLFGPCMTIQPGYGEFQWAVELFKPDMTQSATYSICTGILQLFKDGDTLVGIIVFLFSAAFPVWKISVFWAGIHAMEAGKPGSTLLNLLGNLGKLSMLDVFVIALLVLAIKGLPGGTRIQIGWGIWAFCGSVLMGLWISSSLKKMPEDSQETS